MKRKLCRILAELFLSSFISNKEQSTDQKQKDIAIDCCKIAAMLCHQSTNAGTKDEKQDHAIILYTFVSQFLIFALGIAEK